MDDEQAVERSRRWWLKTFVFLGILLVVVILLVGWNRVASSDRLCASCHVMVASVASAERSVHSSLTCLDCHTRPGLAGSLRYLPTLARETVATVTGWDIAHGVLESRSCTDCHTDLTTNPSLEQAHRDAKECASCHGEVAHPPLPLLEARPTPVPSGAAHPEDYIQNHGVDVAADPASCTTCHRTDFCETCHFKAVFPHPKDWISQHGLAQEEQGAQACTSCHPTTFCVGCHGTEIPHLPDWLGQHWRDLQDASVQPCLLCHPKTDCTTCHSEHGVHREQDLFVGGSS
jgi:hypothetical protein